jgi:hypothetical protein
VDHRWVSLALALQTGGVMYPTDMNAYQPKKDTETDITLEILADQAVPLGKGGFPE